MKVSNDGLYVSLYIHQLRNLAYYVFVLTPYVIMSITPRSAVMALLLYLLHAYGWMSTLSHPGNIDYPHKAEKD